MSMQGIIELAWERARDGDQRAGRYVLTACLNYICQLDGDDIEVQVLETILAQILAGTDARKATWTRPGDGNPKWKRQWRDSVLVSSMRLRIKQGMGVNEAARHLADQKFETFTDEAGNQLTAAGIKRIWYRDKDREDAHITFGGLGDEWDDPA